MAVIFGVTTEEIFEKRSQTTHAEQPVKYSQVIAKLIMDANLKGTSSSKAVAEEMKKVLNELDLARYKRLIESLKKRE